MGNRSARLDALLEMAEAGLLASEEVARLLDLAEGEVTTIHAHKWETYEGFTDSYKYCATCGVRKSIADKALLSYSGSD